MIFNSNGTPTTDNDDISLEATTHIMEMVMMDGLSPDELSMFLENQTEISDAIDDEVLTERTIVRLDKHAKFSRAQKMAIFSIAKEKKDPKFKKLLTIWKMERFLEDYLDKKYGNEAKRRAKKAIAKKSKSSFVKKAVDNVKKQLNKNEVKKKK